MYEYANSDSYFPDQSSIEARLKDCRDGLRSLIASLQPHAPLDEIDVPRLDSMIEDIRDYILLFDPVVNQFTDVQMEESDIMFLEQACKSTSTIYRLLGEAINQLRTARKALVIIKESIMDSRGFNVTLQNDCFTCYGNCRQALIGAVGNIHFDNIQN